MKRNIGRFVYGDSTYFVAHIIIGVIAAALIVLTLFFAFGKSYCVVLNIISYETIALSASLLGFQLAGVSILIASTGNKKLQLLAGIQSDIMIYKVFVSSISMFLVSILLMLISLNLLVGTEEKFAQGKEFVDYCSVATFFYGMIFLFSSIKLLKYLYSDTEKENGD